MVYESLCLDIFSRQEIFVKLDNLFYLHIVDDCWDIHPNIFICSFTSCHTWCSKLILHSPFFPSILFASFWQWQTITIRLVVVALFSYKVLHLPPVRVSMWFWIIFLKKCHWYENLYINNIVCMLNHHSGILGEHNVSREETISHTPAQIIWIEQRNESFRLVWWLIWNRTDDKFGFKWLRKITL